MEDFSVFVIDNDQGNHIAEFRNISLADLPAHDVLVEIEYSSLNYKDGLAITGKGRIARRTPMVAGIDLAGTVVESKSSLWSPGDKVVLNGWGLSETEWGAFSRFQRVKGEWLVRLPDGFSPQEAMAIGTAGYTAALCVDALEDWGSVAEISAPIIVTGAAGGVGSVAVSLLSAKGYKVSASTGRPETAEYLRFLGATEIVDRTTLSEPGKPLQEERWAGAVDSVGDTTLANVIAQMKYGAAVAACGMAGGVKLPSTVFPHILRGVALLGIDSVYAPRAKRERAWRTLADHLD
ncbi:oxidoreductase, partial [Mesorhizobium sp. M7A.F.Ca.US.011.01.1.1]|uniref:MDR family oxidoreductase n=1 Tax=Mesorhizobium sp. M7A.F.Ca.US.011.01.1.1 TaxID=2496741 RepID=UPI000FD5947E